MTFPCPLHRVAGRGKPLCRSSPQWPNGVSHWPPVVGGALPSTRLRRAVRVRVRTEWTRTSNHLLPSVPQGDGPMGGDRGRQPQLPQGSDCLRHPRGYGEGPRYGVQEGHGEGCVCLLAVGQEVWSRKQQRTAQGHHCIAAEQIRDRAGPGGVQPGEVWGAPCCALC